jgi:ribosome recycling factor
METVAAVMHDADQKMAKTLSVLHEQFTGIRTGKASPALVENVKVMYYGNQTRLRDIANISAPEVRLLVINSYDPTALPEIEKAILAANLGVTPANDGRVIRVPIPELTQERRQELTKVARRMSEDARIAARNIRRESNELIKKLQKDGKIPEDDRDQALKKIQDNTDQAIAKVDSMVKAKETEIMAV